MKAYIFLFKSIFFVLTGLLILAVFSFRPAPKFSNCNSQKIKARVSKVYSVDKNNLVFELEDVKGKFYINLQQTLDINTVSVEDLLLNREVTITYPKHWTIFDPFNRVHPIFEISYQEEIIYTET